MSDELYGLTGDDVAALRELFRAFKSGRLNQVEQTPKKRQLPQRLDTYLGMALTEITPRNTVYFGTGRVSFQAGQQADGSTATTTTSGFLIVDVGDEITAAISSSAWIVEGQEIYLSDGTYAVRGIVTDIPDGTHVTFEVAEQVTGITGQTITSGAAVSSNGLWQIVDQVVEENAYNVTLQVFDAGDYVLLQREPYSGLLLVVGGRGGSIETVSGTATGPDYTFTFTATTPYLTANLSASGSTVVWDMNILVASNTTGGVLTNGTQELCGYKDFTTSLRTDQLHVYDGGVGFLIGNINFDGGSDPQCYSGFCIAWSVIDSGGNSPNSIVFHGSHVGYGGGLVVDFFNSLIVAGAFNTGFGVYQGGFAVQLGDTTVIHQGAWGTDGIGNVIKGGIVTSISGTSFQPLDSTLTALAAYNTNGLLTQTAADTFTGRTITSTGSTLTISNGNGVAGNPNADIDLSHANTWTGQQDFTGGGSISYTTGGVTYSIAAESGVTPLTMKVSDATAGSLVSAFNIIHDTSAAPTAGTGVSVNLLVPAQTASVPASIGSLNWNWSTTGAAATRRAEFSATFQSATLTFFKARALSTTTTGIYFMGNGTPVGVQTGDVLTALIAFNLMSAGQYNTSSLSGQVTVPNGGSGLASATAYAVLCGGTTSTGAFQSIASVGTAGQRLTSNGAGALPTMQTVAALTATNTTLTFSGSYNGETARTVGINLGNANTWTGIQQLPGVTDGSNATSGYLGEYTSDYKDGTSAVSLTTSTDTDVVQITLTDGDWDVEAIASFSFGSTIISPGIAAYLSTTSAVSPGSDGSEGYFPDYGGVTVKGNGSVAINKRFSVTGGSITVYLVVNAGFVSGTVDAFGGITARRVR